MIIPNFINLPKLILHPALLAEFIATTLVADAKMVIFPPRSDPIDSAHQRDMVFPSEKVGSIKWMILETIAALATFPITDVKAADTQSTIAAA